MMMLEHSDLFIVGGGMVGAALAAACAPGQIRIHVLETNLPASFMADSAPDLRVSAISASSRQLLESIGAWQEIMQMRSAPYQRMLVWEGEESNGTLFSAGEIGENELGHIIENRIVQLACLNAMQAHDNIELISHDPLESMTQGPDHCHITLRSGREFSCSLVVAADGAQSQTRKLAGIGLDAHDYPMHAFVATVGIAGGDRDITWQRFTPHGPQSLLPLPGDYASLVWYDRPEVVRDLEQMDEHALLAAFTRTFPQRLPVLTKLVSRGSFALTRRHAQNYYRGRIVLAGDAAHTIHPLAGQGVNLGFQDVKCLATLIIHAANKQEDPGSSSLLRQYQRQRTAPNHAMQRLMDAFCYGFSNEITPLRLLRQFSLKLANRPSPLKREIVRYALGFSPFAKGFDLNLPRTPR